MGYLQRTYSGWLNHRYEWDGPLFRGRFRNRVVEDDDDGLGELVGEF